MKKTLVKILLAFFTIVSTLQLQAQSANRYHEIDEYVHFISHDLIFNPKALTENIIQNTSDDTLKVRGIYSWIAQNIQYDVFAFDHNQRGSTSINEVLRSGKALCEGFSVLFQSMCRDADIPCEIIEGYAKGYGYRPGQPLLSANHSWNAVKLGNQWQLVDVTWATGDPRSAFHGHKEEFLEKYFLTDPKIFVYDHLPEDPTWQLLTPKVSLNAFSSGDRAISAALEDTTHASINLYRPADYESLSEFDREIVRSKRATAFNPQNQDTRFHLGDAFLFKAISITDDLYKFPLKDLTDSTKVSHNQFYAYIDSASNIYESFLNSGRKDQVLKMREEINYQKGVFHYELGSDAFLKANTNPLASNTMEYKTILKFTQQEFEKASPYFRQISAGSLYYSSAQDYIKNIDDFNNRNRMLVK